MSNASLPVGLVCKNFDSLTPPCQSAWFEKSTPWPPYQRAWCKLYFVVIPGAQKAPKAQEAPKCRKRTNRKKRHKAKHKARGEHLENFGKIVRKATGRLWKDPRRSREGSGRSREDPGGLWGGPGRPQQGSEDLRKAPGVPGRLREAPGRPRETPGEAPGRPWETLGEPRAPLPEQKEPG